MTTKTASAVRWIAQHGQRDATEVMLIALAAHMLDLHPEALVHEIERERNTRTTWLAERISQAEEWARTNPKEAASR